ncbi:NAD(P)/FAD-dependent oxidoreductase [Streptomyces sp. NA02950]|uniref:FAD-dependent oxidoreductase n=1 Tax=Streptomyces sp. NA02950 TaxID=2742137 RepID=UPI0015921B28|nr:FAD-dependent oxidoreductase [Streptomyces sp. NA02950]QKV97007.1 NAD(P)/FAD-dependent oxidoreductase [Streptomyces sp. NA02950]
MTDGRTVVVGNGPAAHRLTERLRRHGHQGPVTVLGAEPAPAYNRALLASVLDRTLPPAALALPRPAGDTRVRTGVTVTRIDRRALMVHTDDGTAHAYDTLVLATGARPNVPALPGARGGDGVHTLRTLADCARIDAGPAARARPQGPVAVLGGGILGVEAALALRRTGREVTLVHRRSYPMNRQLDPTGGRLLAACLEGQGIALCLGRRAIRYGSGRLLLDDGRTVEAPTLLMCTGVTPETRLAGRAGLAVRRGVVVDDRLRTTDPRIHALGDCAEYDGQVAGLVTHAWDQAETLARVLTGGPGRRPAARTVTRLRAPGVDVASIGPPGAPDGPGGPGGPGEESMTLCDPARNRYAALTLRDGRIARAVLLGLPRGAAAVSRLYDRDEPVPHGWSALLLGRAADEHGGPVELPADAVVCVCNNVTMAALVRAWHSGSREPAEVAAVTGATTGCGTCAEEVRRVCASLEAAHS